MTYAIMLKMVMTIVMGMKTTSRNQIGLMTKAIYPTITIALVP